MPSRMAVIIFEIPSDISGQIDAYGRAEIAEKVSFRSDSF